MPIKVPEENKEYLRIGCDYFRIIKKPDRFGINRTHLKVWNKKEIQQDFSTDFVKDLPKYIDFVNIPDNQNKVNTPDGFYNFYHDFPHKPKQGKWHWTFVLLKHVFKTQIRMGLQYLQILYLHPEKLLPVLALVSETRETGKTTFLSWLNMLFGSLMYQLNSDGLSRNFNSHFASSLIIGIDESIVSNNGKNNPAMAKLKSLSTAHMISVEFKGVDSFQIPFFGKFILTSNDETDFINVDEKEIRFWIRKLDVPKISNHNILNDMVSEIPAFLHYLTTMPKLDFSKSRMYFTAEQLKTQELTTLKRESKSKLFKEIHELFTDYFENNTLVAVYFTATDLKKLWFKDSPIVRNTDIKHCIKKEFNISPEAVSSYYKPIENEQIGKTGRYYTFTRDMFTGVAQSIHNQDLF